MKRFLCRLCVGLFAAAVFAGSGFALEPHSGIPVGILIVFPDVVGKGLHVVVEQGMLEFCRLAIYHDMFVDFDIGHGGILVAQAALEAAFAAAKQREFLEAGAAVAEFAA